MYKNINCSSQWRRRKERSTHRLIASVGDKCPLGSALIIIVVLHQFSYLPDGEEFPEEPAKVTDNSFLLEIKTESPTETQENFLDCSDESSGDDSSEGELILFYFSTCLTNGHSKLTTPLFVRLSIDIWSVSVPLNVRLGI